ncbi:hypothetical protein MBLNU459_g3436t1 [Dothideomycetes sp. NU459]
MAAANHSSSSVPFGCTYTASPLRVLTHAPLRDETALTPLRQPDTFQPPAAESNPDPSGPPLLDTGESSVLQTFFNDPDQFDNPAALSDSLTTTFMPPTDPKNPLDMSWLYQSQTLGHTPHAAFDAHDLFSARPHRPSSDHMTRHMSAAAATPVSNADNILPYIPAGAPEEVLTAASTLQNFFSSQAHGVAQTPRQQTQQHQPHYHMHHSFDTTSPPTMHQQPLSYTSPTTATQTMYGSTPYPAANGHYRGSLDSAVIHESAPNFTLPARNSFHGNPPIYRFGSDSNFNHNGYTGPLDGLENVQPHMAFARVFGGATLGITSAESSLPQSPDVSRHDQQHAATFQRYLDQSDDYEQKDVKPPKPKRRRKTKSAGAEDANLDSYDAPSPGFHNQSSPEPNNVSGADSPENFNDDMPAGSLKRRKSESAAQARANALARKNLTEEQKRENHIKSEQKRRNIIKEGYRDLNDLVPNLKQGGFSKSAVLTETVRELEGLQAGNAQMEQLLESLKAKAAVAKAGA